MPITIASHSKTASNSAMINRIRFIFTINAYLAHTDLWGLRCAKPASYALLW